ncbi:MAG: hypothetical protein RL885_23030, partial [Planctomycetota bacterium]
FLDARKAPLVVLAADRDDQHDALPGEKETHSAWKVSGPQGIDSGGLPVRVYAAHGSSAERGIRNAKVHNTGPVDQTYLIKGVAHPQRLFVLEAIEKAD